MRKWLLKKLNGTPNEEVFGRISAEVATKQYRDVTYDILSRISLPDLEDVFDKMRIHSEVNGYTDYSFMAELIKKVSTY